MPQLELPAHHQLSALASRGAGGGGVFCHPSQPRVVSVDARGDVREIDAFSGAVCASGSIGGGSVGGAAMVRWRSHTFVATLSRGGSVGMWDVCAQLPHQTRVLAGDKLRGQDVACACGTQQAGGPLGLLFAVRTKSSTIQAVRLQPLGIAHDKVAVDPACPAAIVTAMCCHPSRPWLLASLGMAPGAADALGSRPENDVRIWDYSGVAVSHKGRHAPPRKGDSDLQPAEDGLEEEALKGKLRPVAVCRRGTTINAFPRLHVTSIAVSQGGHALLAAIGEDGLLLWSIVAAEQHGGAEVPTNTHSTNDAAAAVATTTAANAAVDSTSSTSASMSTSSKRSRARTIGESSVVEIHALARQAWGGVRSSGQNSAGLYPARIAFDEQASMVHFIARNRAQSNASLTMQYTLNTLSLLPLHLNGIVQSNPLPVLASTDLHGQANGSRSDGSYEAVDTHLVVHPFCRRIVAVPLRTSHIRYAVEPPVLLGTKPTLLTPPLLPNYSTWVVECCMRHNKCRSLWRVVSHDFLGGVAGVAPAVARPPQTPPAVFLAHQPPLEKLTGATSGAGSPPNTSIPSLKASSMDRDSRCRRGKSSCDGNEGLARARARFNEEHRYQCDGELADGVAVPVPVIEAAKLWQQSSTVMYISFRGGCATAQAMDRTKVVAPPPEFRYGRFTLAEAPLERDIDDKESSKHHTIAILPSSEKILLNLMAAKVSFQASTRAIPTTSAPPPRLLIPVRALSLHDGSAVIILYCAMDHKYDDIRSCSRSREVGVLLPRP
jgi:hypothetical protein